MKKRKKTQAFFPKPRTMKGFEQVIQRGSDAAIHLAGQPLAAPNRTGNTLGSPTKHNGETVHRTYNNIFPKNHLRHLATILADCSTHTSRQNVSTAPEETESDQLAMHTDEQNVQLEVEQRFRQATMPDNIFAIAHRLRNLLGAVFAKWFESIKTDMGNMGFSTREKRRKKKTVDEKEKL